MTEHDPDNAPEARFKHQLGKAVLSIPLRAATESQRPAETPRDPALPEAIGAERLALATPDGRLAYYRSVLPDASSPPLLLIHSINAAGSAYEVGPIFDAIRVQRTVYAPDMPGFGFSDRVKRLYTPRIMTDAVIALVEDIRRQQGGVPVDALALSLSAEFLARAAAERPELFGRLCFVSPTGFDRRAPRNGPPGSHRGMPWLYNVFTAPPWRAQFFRLLTSRVSIRYFLEKTWGSKAIDEGLLAYDYRTTHQPGAEHAPYSFVSGFLFSNDSTRLYETLAMPVLMLHGTRGDFTDYSYAKAFAGRPNWRIETLATGALPHFEEIGTFMTALQAFLDRRIEISP